MCCSPEISTSKFRIYPIRLASHAVVSRIMAPFGEHPYLSISLGGGPNHQQLFINSVNISLYRDINTLPYSRLLSRCSPRTLDLTKLSDNGHHGGQLTVPGSVGCGLRELRLARASVLCGAVETSRSKLPKRHLPAHRPVHAVQRHCHLPPNPIPSHLSSSELLSLETTLERPSNRLAKPC